MPRNMRSLATAMAVTVAGLAMSASSASANFFEFSSSISIGATSGIASISSTSISSPGTITLTTTNGSVITLTANQRATVASHLNGNPNPVFGSNANFGSVGAVPAAVQVDTISIAFSYTVTLTDYTAANTPLANPNGTGTVVFSGLITGDIGGGGVGLQFSNFTPTPNVGGPPPPAGIVFIPSVVNYLAQPYSATPPDGIVNGVLSSTFTVTAVPEPTSMTLMGLGGIGLIGLYRRKMKRAA
jgi:hypothetical protein